MIKTVSYTVSAARRHVAIDVVHLAFETAFRRLQAHGLLNGDLVITIASHTANPPLNTEPIITHSAVRQRYDKPPHPSSLRKRILELVELSPWTNVELAKRLKANPASVASLTRRLARRRLVHRRLSSGHGPASRSWVYCSPMGVDVR